MNNNTAALAYPVNVACERIGIGRVKMYELIGKGEIKSFKIGGKRLVTESELQRIVADGMQQSNSDAAL